MQCASKRRSTSLDVREVREVKITQTPLSLAVNNPDRRRVASIRRYPHPEGGSILKETPVEHHRPSPQQPNMQTVRCVAKHDSTSLSVGGISHQRQSQPSLNSRTAVQGVVKPSSTLEDPRNNHSHNLHPTQNQAVSNSLQGTDLHSTTSTRRWTRLTLG